MPCMVLWLIRILAAITFCFSRFRRTQGKYEEAEPLFERSLAIREKVLGPYHPAVAESLNDQAVLLSKQVSKSHQIFLCVR